jgi:hypothetical protein
MDEVALCARCRKENPNRTPKCAHCGCGEFVWLCPVCGESIPFLKTRRIALKASLGAALALPVSIWIYADTEWSQVLSMASAGAIAGLFLAMVDWHTLRHMVLPLSLRDGRLVFDTRRWAKAWRIEEPISQGAWASFVCTVAVVVGLGEWPYGYYRLLRLLLCGVSLFLLSGDKSRLQDWHQWLLVSLAVLYNPVIPVELGDKELWAAVNIATIVVFWSVTLRGVRPRS